MLKMVVVPIPSAIMWTWTKIYIVIFDTLFVLIMRKARNNHLISLVFTHLALLISEHVIYPQTFLINTIMYI